jgi:hypothetical protein
MVLTFQFMENPVWLAIFEIDCRERFEFVKDCSADSEDSAPDDRALEVMPPLFRNVLFALTDDQCNSA